MPEEPTAPDLVRLTRLAIESVGRGDFDAAMSMYGPESVFDGTPLGVGVFEGVTAIRQEVERWVGAFDEFGVEVEETLELGNGVTFAVALQRGRPAGGSGSLQLHFASVTEWTEGFVARVTQYTDIDEARAAAERVAEARRPTPEEP